jgi:hypothetical protein
MPRQKKEIDAMSSSSAPASAAAPSMASLATGFVAGAVAVPVFHQLLLGLLYLTGVVPFAPFSLAPTKPFGVPDIVSISFWGGVWGVVFTLTVARWFRGAAYWIASFVAGGGALTLVFAFVVWPLKFGGLPPQLGGLFVIGFLLNAAWGIGWALCRALIDRLRGAGA